MSKPETPEQRQERILAELRETVSEAAGVLKDLRTTIDAARARVEDYLQTEVQRALDQLTAQWQADAETYVKDALTNIKASVDKACAGSLEHMQTDWQYALVMSEVFKIAYRELVEKGLVKEPGTLKH